MPRRTVSVIIPTHNDAAFVSEAVESALSQSEPPTEVIVVDDGSTDGTREMLRPHSNITHIYQENRGAAAARNRGIREARGEVIAFLDADDLWDRDKLKTCVKTFSQPLTIPDVVLYTGYVVQEYPSDITHPPMHRRLAEVTPTELVISFNEAALHTSTVVLPKRLLEEVGGFDESLPRGEDWDLWVRLAERYRFEYVDMVLARIRNREHSLTQRLSHEWQEVTVKVILKSLKRRPDLYAPIEHRLYSRYHLKLGLSAYEKLDFRTARINFAKSVKDHFNWEGAKYFLKSLLGRSVVKKLRAFKER